MKTVDKIIIVLLVTLICVFATISAKKVADNRDQFINTDKSPVTKIVTNPWKGMTEEPSYWINKDLEADPLYICTD